MSYLIKVSRDGVDRWKLVPGAFYHNRPSAEDALRRLRKEFPKDIFRLEIEGS